MDLTTELPRLVSSDSSVIQNGSSLDITDLNTTHVLARDGPLSSLSDTMCFSFSPEAISGATRSELEPTVGPYTQSITDPIHGFQNQDTFFTDFETFTQNLCDESLLRREQTVNYINQPDAIPQPLRLEVPLTRSNDCGCTSHLS
jgi:hypothetical protein